jgi:hypothetical protein
MTSEAGLPAPQLRVITSAMVWANRQIERSDLRVDTVFSAVGHVSDLSHSVQPE